jgi:PAS domain S-box-containing protein
VTQLLQCAQTFVITLSFLETISLAPSNDTFMSSALTLEAVQQRLHELVLLDAGETQPLLPNPDQDPMIATLNALQRRLQSAVSVADWRHQVLRQNVHRIVRSGEWIYRPATHELAWSQEAYDLLGASRDLWDQEAQESFGALPMLPMSVERFALLLRPADAETVATQLGAVSNETASIDLSFQLRTQTGETRWLRMRGHLVKEHQMVCGALQDLTAEVQLAEEQKRASAALQREQELSQQVRALTNSAYWTINIDTQQLWWSPEHFDLWEVEPTTPLTMEVIAQRVHPEDQPKVDAWLHQLQAQPTQAEINFRVQRPTRGIRWMTSTGAARQLDDGTTELYGATRDITEQQEALRLLESYQYAIDQSSIVAITNRRGNITYVNDKFTEISGYSREELLGNNHRLLKSELHPPDFYDELWHTISRGEVWRGEVCNRSKNGSIYWVDTTIVPIRDIAGRIQQYLSIRTEITQRKLAAEERTKLLRRFQNAAEATQFGLGILDPILGEFLEMNEIYRQQHFEGFDIDLRKSLERVVHHRAEVEQALSDIIQKGATCRVRYSIQQQTGKLRWIEAVGGRVFEGMRPLIHAYTRDITEEIQSELERARLLRRFQLATEVSPLGFAVFDPFDGEYLETNERYRQLMFESEETPNLHQVTQRLTHGRMELELSFRKSMETGNPAHVRVGVVTRGEFRWVEVWGSFFEEDGRKLTQVYLLEVTQEVEAKQAQERLMRRMQFATETIGFGTALIDVETGAFLEMNDAHRRQHFGASDPENLHAMLQRVRQGAPDIQTVFEQTYSEQTVHETRLQIEVDGQLRWIQAWGTALEENGAPQMYVITRDITHTVFAEQERERLVQRLTLALRMADMSVDLFDWDTKVQEERTESFFQRNRLPATTGQTLSEITQQLVHPDDLPALLESHATLGDSSARAEFRLKRNDGSWLWVESYAQLIYQDGHTKMLMLWRNITDQKRAQLERARLQQRMQFTSETTGFEIVIFDPQTYQFVETNELFRQFMEARNLRDMSDYFAQVTQKKSDLAVAIQLTLKTNQTQYVRFAFHHEGVDLWRASWARAAVEGERTLVYVLLRDCTAEVEADQEHDLLVSRLQIAMTIGKYGFQQFDLLSRTYDQFDERLRDLYGFTAEDGPITVPMVAARIHPDDALKLRSHLQQAIRTGTNDRAEFRVQQADGSWRWLEGSGQIVTIQGRRKAIGIVRDIHARKTATEQERLQLLEYIQFSIEAGQFVTYQFDPMTKEFLLVDERFCEFFGVHKDRDLSQADVTTRMHPEDAKRWEQATQELLGEGAGKQRLELRLQHPQRGWRWVQTLRALREINGRKLIVGIGRDITREKTLEQERESLVDKLNMSLDVVNLGTFWQLRAITGSRSKTCSSTCIPMTALACYEPPKSCNKISLLRKTFVWCTRSRARAGCRLRARRSEREHSWACWGLSVTSPKKSSQSKSAKICCMNSLSACTRLG